MKVHFFRATPLAPLVAPFVLATLIHCLLNHVRLFLTRVLALSSTQMGSLFAIAGCLRILHCIVVVFVDALLVRFHPRLICGLLPDPPPFAITGCFYSCDHSYNHFLPIADAPVGGDSDCWQALFMLDEESEFTRPLSEVVMLLEVALRERSQSPALDRTVTRLSTGECVFCFEPLCDCAEIEKVPDADPDADAKGFLIALSWSNFNRLHISGYRYMSSSQGLADSVSFFDLRKALINHDNAFFASLPGYQAPPSRLPVDMRSAEVGANGFDIIYETITHAPTLAPHLT
ncbi:hypothetical protein FRC12_012849 [Ceratobasidium sp. 428]|nr:hypothetical protein FRC12_012849 [Ceratobasidium sp. 428]